jgi:hypothetical protein
VTPHPTIQPASTAEWQVYHDPKLPFGVPVPPSWQIKTYSQTSTTLGDCSYTVGFFPPNGYVPDDLPSKDHEHIDITVALGCPPVDPLKNPHWKPEPTSILISGVQALHIVDDNSDWISRWAFATFGLRQYSFELGVTPQEKGLADLPLFYGMLASFKYLG